MAGAYEAAVKKHKAGDHDSAVELLVEIVESDPDNEPAFALMADIFAGAGDLLPAIECYSRAAEINPQKKLSISKNSSTS